MRSRPGFTLVEVLVVVALIGVIAVTGFAPIVFTVEKLRDLRSGYGSETALRLAAETICRDFRQGTILEGDAPARLLRHDVLGGGPDDRLIFWTAARQRLGDPPGSSAYVVVPEPDDDFPFKGLYRWFLPGVAPGDVNPDNLDPGGAELVIPEISGFRVAFYNGKEWVDEYLGPYPRGLRVTLGREDGDYSQVDWLPTGWN